MFYTLLIAIAILPALAHSQQVFPDNQPTTSYIWFRIQPTNYPFTIIQNPEGGLAIFYSHQKYPYRPDSGQQMFVNLYPGYSELWESQLITCRTLDTSNYCLYIDSDFEAITGPQTPERSIGCMSSNQYQTKTLQLSSGETITMLLKDSFNESVEVFVTIFLLVAIIASMLSSKGLKYLSDQFSIQLSFTLCVLIRETSSYIKEAIENWIADSWKFWLFIPLSIIAYQILENLTEKCILKRPSLTLFFSLITFNALLYICCPSLLYHLISYCFILRLKPDPCLCENLSQGQKKNIDEKALRTMRFLFTILHIKLLFAMQSCYLLTLNPYYYEIGLVSIGCIYICDTFRRDRNRRARQKQQGKYKVKIYEKRSELVKQMPSLVLSGVINDQCPICYEAIKSEWALTPCHHLFHSECIHKWLQKSSTCPIDRNKIISDQPVSCLKLNHQFTLDY